MVPSVGSRTGVVLVQSAAHATVSPGATVPSRATDAAARARMLVGLTPAMTRLLVCTLQQTHLKASLHGAPPEWELKYRCPFEGCHQQPLGRSYVSCVAAGAAAPGTCGCTPAVAEHSARLAVGRGQAAPPATSSGAQPSSTTRLAPSCATKAVLAAAR